MFLGPLYTYISILHTISIQILRYTVNILHDVIENLDILISAIAVAPWGNCGAYLVACLGAALGPPREKSPFLVKQDVIVSYKVISSKFH